MSESRPCTSCGAATDYEPLFIEGRDILAKLPHLCDSCREKAAAAAAKEEREAKIEAMKARYESTVPITYRNTDPGHELFNSHTWEHVKKAPWLSRSVGLVGLPGRCKTRMLALAAKKAIYAGCSIGWCNTFELERTTREVNDRTLAVEARRQLREWRTCRVLFLDDLGKSIWNPVLETALFELLEHRYAHGLITHWSLNPQPDDADDDFSQIDVLAAALDPDQRKTQGNRFAPILSRLVNNTLIVPVQ